MKQFFNYKNFKLFLVALSLAAFIDSCKKDSSSVDSGTAPQSPKFSTSNNKNASSSTLSGGFTDGVDLQPSYYNGGNPTFGWSLMKQQGNIKTLRIEIDPSTGVTTSQAAGWISQAKANGYTSLICTFHEYGGSSNASDLVTAATWWKNNYKALGGGFTINLCNEWGSGTMTSNAFAAAYNEAIPIVRQVYSGPIIIDCAGYGHDVVITSDAVLGTNGTKISDGNIVLSNHIYPDGYVNSLNRTAQESDLDYMSATGKPCIIGEFGNTPSGSCNWQQMVQYAKSKGWAVLAWSWNGDGTGMNMVSPAWSSNPTATSFTLSSYFSQVYPFL
jgi:mannan endo-1,4-beta-mannosidase